MEKTRRSVLILSVIIMLLFEGVSSLPLTPASAKTLHTLISNVSARLKKWIRSIRTSTKAAVTPRPTLKFEGGYTVETVFDGSKHGIVPHSLEILPNGEILILDSANSNIYRISSSISLYSRPKLVAGSSEGYSGHVDGKAKEARLNHPKGLVVDSQGNIYVADTMNMAIRKISDTGVTTIAGGKPGHGEAHIDGPSEHAKFSDDFDLVYVESSCSLLVIDRGTAAIREIQLQFEDCAYQYENGLTLGIAILFAAGFFGYMLSTLQNRPQQNDLGVLEEAASQKQYQVMHNPDSPLISTSTEPERTEETFFGSLFLLFFNTWTSILEIITGLLPTFGRKPIKPLLSPYPRDKSGPAWPVQESFVIPDEDEPPPPSTRAPTPMKTYAFMSREAEKIPQSLYNGIEGNLQKPQRYQNHHYERGLEGDNGGRSAVPHEKRAFGPNDHLYLNQNRHPRSTSGGHFPRY